LTILSLTVLLVVLAGCTTGGAVEALRDRDWSLVWVQGFDTLPSGITTPTARFGSDGRFGGNTGCNSAGASYTASGDNLRLDAMITTKRACLDPAGNQLEVAYVGAFERTRKFRIVNDQLELMDEGGTVLARFR
jgi:putative lipoprotein